MTARRSRSISGRMPAIARWLPLVLMGQLLLLLCCMAGGAAGGATVCALYPAVDALKPAASHAQLMAEHGPDEVQQAARAFNAMQLRIQDHLKARAQILAAISHDLQTPITRMKLRVEMAEQPELRDKLLSDLDNMSRPVREGIAYARSSEVLEEKRQSVSLNALLDSVVCDYQDVGKAVNFVPCTGHDTFAVRPQAPGSWRAGSDHPAAMCLMYRPPTHNPTKRRFRQPEHMRWM